ncbi:hypothetical protein GXW82_41455 [Streptacidiphilus sp. 4-A2]|nr:hypothetical protein [Streptacidiphilus sp. 4-A2]
MDAVYRRLDERRAAASAAAWRGLEAVIAARLPQARQQWPSGESAAALAQRL